jgi:NhaP-type Na+/H+ or K+/H+ antiporter
VSGAAISPGLGAPEDYAVGLLFAGLAVLVAILALSHQLAGDLGVGPPGERDETEPTFALTSEAGLNDGPALGGWALSALAARLRERSLVDRELDGWAALGAMLAIYGVTQVVGAYGFLAAFAGGIAFRRRERDHTYNQAVHAGAETVERVLELAMILLLGSLITIDGLAAPGVAGWLLVPILLLLIRPAASAVGLVGSPLRPRERIYVGWFGVRGIGSLYYASAAVGAGVLAPGGGRPRAGPADGTP